LVDKDVFDGEGGDLGEQDASEGVGYRGVEADEREGRIVWGGSVEFDVEGLGLIVSILLSCR
jgi:hypothetical protein